MSLPAHEIPPDVDPAWHDIEQLVAQIDELSKTRVPLTDFSAELVGRTVRALEAVGGALWLNNAQGQLSPVHETNLWSTEGDVESHRRLAESARSSGKCDLIPPGAAAAHGDERVNPTALMLLFSVIEIEQRVVGVLELGQRPTEDVSVRRGQMRLLAVLCELFAHYLTFAELNQLRHTRSMWQEYRRFACEVHLGTDLRETAYHLANDGKRFVGCDRISVLVPAGRRVRLLAVSGLDTFDRRANAVTSLEKLADVVAKTDDVLHYDGNQLDIAPEIQQRLEQHIDRSHARTLVAVPLHPPATGSDAPIESAASKVVGVLVAECFDAKSDPTFEERLDLIVSPSAVAMKNALERHRLPLLRSARTGWSSPGWRLAKLAMALLLLAGLIGVAFVIPADFRVSASGEMQPEQRRDVFAPIDAEVAEFLFQHDDLVQAGQQLMLLKSPDLELELQRVQGEHETIRKRLWAVESARLQSSPDAESSPGQLAAEEEELKQRLASHQDQISLLREELTKLNVRSPIDGRVLTWDVETLLRNRPVQRGQVLFSVGNIDGPWVAELEVPDDRIGYLLSTQQQLESPLDVSFELATRRGQTHHGQVERIASRTEVNEKGEATVLVTVAVDADAITELRPGATISAKIHCGRRSLAFVWLHDVIEVVREWIIF